eukprot:jgi/Chlat1/9102/Chrsp97S09273
MAQVGCIPHILAGEDVIGTAQTGSGKTAAFALPIINTLAQDPYGIYAVVLTPTRELAFQIDDQFRALGASLNLKTAVIVGGLDMTTQSTALAKRPHVVIATPGRLMDHVQSSAGAVAASLSRVRYLVLDEADRLLDPGFEDEMRVVLEALGGGGSNGDAKRGGVRRQTLLFSATVTSSVAKLQEVTLSDAYHFRAYEGLKTVATLRQEYLFIPAKVKEVYLFHIMSSLESLSPPVRSAIVFLSTCRACHLLALTLRELGIQDVVALHSLKTQRERMASLNRFRSGAARVLLATDVASRGLDIPTVDLVLNYDVPARASDYVHRVGRTARAGRGGRAATLVTQYDVALVAPIEELVGAHLAAWEPDEKEVLKGITKVYHAKRAASLAMAESGFDDLVRARRRACFATPNALRMQPPAHGP